MVEKKNKVLNVVEAMGGGVFTYEVVFFYAVYPGIVSEGDTVIFGEAVAVV